MNTHRLVTVGPFSVYSYFLGGGRSLQSPSLSKVIGATVVPQRLRAYLSI